MHKDYIEEICMLADDGYTIGEIAIMVNSTFEKVLEVLKDNDKY